MHNIETLYSSYQELLLDLDIFGRLVGSQVIDDKESFKDLLFQEYAKARPIPTLESRDSELSEPVSADFHVSYRQELELSSGEELIDWDSDDEDVEQGEVDADEGDYEVPEDFPKHLFRVPMSVEERNEILHNHEYFRAKESVEDFTGDASVVETSFGSIEKDDSSVYIEDSDRDNGYYSEEFSYEEDEDFSDEDEYQDDDDSFYNYDDDVYEEDEEFEEDIGVSDSDSEEDFEDDEGEIEFLDVSYDNPEPVVQKPQPVTVTPPPIVLPTEGTQRVEEVKEDIPSDILQYLRLHPRCEISEVLKHYPRKDLERYIRVGKVIKKGTKVYI